MRALALYTPDYFDRCLAATTELVVLPDLPLPVMASARVFRADALLALARIPDTVAEFALATPLVDALQSQPLRI